MVGLSYREARITEAASGNGAAIEVINVQTRAPHLLSPWRAFHGLEVGDQRVAVSDIRVRSRVARAGRNSGC